MDLVDSVDNLDEKAKALITAKPKLLTVNYQLSTPIAAVDFDITVA